MHIGGVDSTVVKHPHTLEPYIPGSSIKGKVRSLLELYSGVVNVTGGNVLSMDYWDRVKDFPEAKNILELFGCSADNKKEDNNFGVARLSFCDSYINQNWKNNNEDFVLSETKAEVSIDRKTSAASKAGPRFIERVPSGIEFDFSVSIKIFEEDNSNELIKTLKKGLRLLELDALGGSGSRGYGRVEFKDLKIEGEVLSLPSKL
jgi:CRISPR-associated protein Csm3